MRTSNTSHWPHTRCQTKLRLTLSDIIHYLTHPPRSTQPGRLKIEDNEGPDWSSHSMLQYCWSNECLCLCLCLCVCVCEFSFFISQTLFYEFYDVHKFHQKNETQMHYVKTTVVGDITLINKTSLN